MKSREGQEVAAEGRGGARVRTVSREASGADGNEHCKGSGGGGGVVRRGHHYTSLWQVGLCFFLAMPVASESSQSRD